MTQYAFTPIVQAGINSGLLKQAVAKTGELLPHAVDATGKIVEIAKSVPSLPVKPLVSVIKIGLECYQVYQTDQGFKQTYEMLNALQRNIGVLQATTALIGVGTVASVGISAVNLYQTLKIREDIAQMRQEMKDGFLDLKQVLQTQNAEILARIDRVAADVEYRHHRTILVQAYGHFVQALNWLRDALKLPDPQAKTAAIVGAQGMLFKALAEYENPELFQQTNVVGVLRRRECAWGIDQAITMSFQLQGAEQVASNRLLKLQEKMKRDMLEVANLCSSEAELDFVFPEILYLQEQDLTVLNSWQSQVEWIAQLSPDTKRELVSANSPELDNDEINSTQEIDTVTEPSEQLLYESLKPKSHYDALKDLLKIKINSDLRANYQVYISQSAHQLGMQALAPANWAEVSDLVMVNLYWYFKMLPKGEQVMNEYPYGV